MRKITPILCGSVAAALAFATGPMAQTMPPSSGPAPMKSIGTPQQQVVPSLIVLNSRGATLANGVLTLSGVSPNAIIFADRPVRSAGHALTSHLIEEWAEGSDSFAKDPPNATVSGFDKAARSVKDAVLVLRSPRLDGDTLTFKVEVLEGDLAGADGPASIFIDIIGMPMTPFSYAGAARRTVRRGAFYAGAYGYPPPPPPMAYPMVHPYYHPYYRY